MILAAAVLALLGADETPTRIQLRTERGDIVIELDRSAAPRHAKQIVELTRAGIYDGSSFSRVIPGLLVQLAGHYLRRAPLSGSQAALLARIPAEFGSGRHVRGSVSMARRDGDPDSADSSFSILAAPAPHLDGKYTIIGRVVSGMDLVDAVIRSAGETEGAPRPTLEVTEAIVMAPGAPLRSGSVSERSRIWMLAGCALNLAGLALAAATRRSRLGSIGLAAALVGFFGVFVGLIDAMNRGQVASATMLGALLTAVVIFRLMSGFERMLPTLEKEKA